jgi:formate-dependent nitrite reductase membrane component NrfD
MSKMATRQWMVTHDWMTRPMPQREWIEKRGWMIWIAETFTALGSGLFLVSLFMNSWWGMLIGWIIIMFLKLPLHIAFWGKPLRFYRTFPPFSNAWKTSWYARGILFSVFFGTFAFVQLVVGHPFIMYLLGSAATPLYTIFAILSGLSALGVGIYSGFLMNYCKGIPFWNQGLLPIVFVLAGVADGFGLIMGIGMAGGDASVVTLAENWSRYLLLINVLIILVYMISASYTSETAKFSVKELIVGRVAFAFWFGLVSLGMVVPALISVAGIYSSELPYQILIIAIICHTGGAFALKYCLLKAGIYRPLLPRVAAY